MLVLRNVPLIVNRWPSSSRPGRRSVKRHLWSRQENSFERKHVRARGGGRPSLLIALVEKDSYYLTIVDSPPRTYSQSLKVWQRQLKSQMWSCNNKRKHPRTHLYIYVYIYNVNTLLDKCPLLQRYTARDQTGSEGSVTHISSLSAWFLWHITAWAVQASG